MATASTEDRMAEAREAYRPVAAAAIAEALAAVQQRQQQRHQDAAA